LAIESRKPKIFNLIAPSDVDVRMSRIEIEPMNSSGVGNFRQRFFRRAVLVFAVLLAVNFTPRAKAQDQDDPPGRVARLGYMEGSVSFQPAGESEWVEAVPNRPMTTGDKLWADQSSRAEVQLGSSSIDLAANTGFSFLNLDDRTVQIELTSGSISVRVRRLDSDEVFEIDTPNQAFTVSEPGRYRVEASENGDYTVVTIREGAGESTGNGQSYTLHAGQRTTFSGTNSLNAEVEQIGNPDDFDNWSDSRWRRYDDSPSGRYCSRDVVGFQDLDDNGDWRPDAQYGNVWYPHVQGDWAPYHDGHWAWIDPWGWTWVDDEPWGYAPFHYGRWVSVGGRWGWVAGPLEVHPVYAPALVVFVGGGGIGGNVAWFPLGPREVYVPSYHVSEGYVNRVNITNTTVNTTVVTNVYNTTIVRNNTTINNVTYVNRNARGAVTAVPQGAFASAQSVRRAAVTVNTRELAAAPISTRAAVPPARQAVLGARANTAGHVAAPPQAVASRSVIAKAAPPPPRPSFAARQQTLQAHPGQPIARQEMAKLRPANAPAPLVKQAPPAKPATATPAMNRPGNQPNQPANRPGNPPAANDRPGANRAQPQPQRGNQPAPANRPEANRPEPNRPPTAQPNNRPDVNRPEPNHPPVTQPNNRPENNRPEPNRPPAAQPNNRPEANRPEPNRPPVTQPNNRPEENRPEPNRPPAAQPNNRPEVNRPETNRPSSQPNPNRPEANRPEPNRPPAQPNNRPEANRPEPNRPAAQPNRPEVNRPEPNRPPAAQPNNRPEARPTPPQRQPQPKPQTADEQKRQEEQRKREEKKPQ
jgi:hypothetical protein